MGYPLDEVEDDAATFGEGARVLVDARAAAGAAGTPRSTDAPAGADQSPIMEERDSPPDGLPVSPSPVPPGALVIELALEWSAQSDRDVNRLSRLCGLLDHHRGDDVVVVRLAQNGREVAALRMRDGARCTPNLLGEIRQELGDVAVRVRRSADIPDVPALSLAS